MGYLLEDFFGVVKVIIVAILAFIFVTAATAFIFGWILMLLVGVIHHEWLPMLPTIGYWWSIVIVFMFRLLIWQNTTSSDK